MRDDSNRSNRTAYLVSSCATLAAMFSSLNALPLCILIEGSNTSQARKQGQQRRPVGYPLTDQSRVRLTA